MSAVKHRQPAAVKGVPVVQRIDSESTAYPAQRIGDYPLEALRGGGFPRPGRSRRQPVFQQSDVKLPLSCGLTSSQRPELFAHTELQRPDLAKQWPLAQQAAHWKL